MIQVINESAIFPDFLALNNLFLRLSLIGYKYFLAKWNLLAFQ